MSAIPTPGPGSVFWELNSDLLVMLAGGRALLMQIAHPAVARGVALHSDFRHHPLRRLYRTMSLTGKLAFHDADTRRRAATGINRAHAAVRGPGYSALDPKLQLWVHATLIDSALVAREQFYRPLDADKAQAFYRESIRLGPLLGIPLAAYPADLMSFRAYVESMLAQEAVPGPVAIELAASLLHPMPKLPARLFRPVNEITSGLLPDPLRAAYGLPPPGVWYRMARAWLPVVRRLVPDPLWETPMARSGRRRRRMEARTAGRELERI